MTYDEIFSVLKNKMANALPNLVVDAVNPEQDFKFYGANSVIIVDIVSRVMRDLKIEAPGPELLVAKNIDELILILLKYANK